jgi:hypothetical protein
MVSSYKLFRRRRFNCAFHFGKQYSETCEIRTPLRRAKSALNSEVSSFHSAIYTENSNLGPDEVSFIHRMSSFRRVAIHRFHYTYTKLRYITLILESLHIILHRFMTYVLRKTENISPKH